MSQPEVVYRNPKENVPRDEPDFSLVLGGPLYQVYLGMGLARPPLRLAVRRVMGISLICWLPLLLLATAAGRLTAGVSVPFLFDPEVHIKLLVALPLLIATEVLVHDRIRKVVAQFPERDIIAREDQPRFERLVASAMRLRNSVTIELALFTLILALGYWMWRDNLKLSVSGITVSAWYAVNEGARVHLTAAGDYYAFISLAIFRFILLRWYFRLFIWYWFLWQLKAMPLHFNFYHPDRAGGLGFLSTSLMAFAPVFVSQTAVLAAVIFTRILYAGAKLPDFKMDIAVALVFFVLVPVLPMGFFAVQLERAGRIARGEFGSLASRYVNDFRDKWVQGNVPAGEALLGTSDIQSLADMANSYTVVSEMHLLPVTKQTFIRLVVVISLPLLPLTLTMVPLNEIIRSVFKMVL